MTGRSRRRRVLRAIGVACGLGFAGILVMCGVAYAMTEIPPPNEAAQSQATVVEWRDGSKMATLGEQQRFQLSLSQMPDHLQKAVLSAENRNFYDQPLGISPQGMARAVWVNLTSSDLQGASTITQQFAQNMYLAHGRTLGIKFQEVFLTLKLEQKMSKDKILEGYMNTIYFGRDGVYGVEAAAREYFGTSASQLDVAQSAFLAAVLNSPGSLDPSTDPENKKAAVDRWQYVVDGMVKEGWLAPARAQSLQFPKVNPPSDNETYEGPQGHVLVRVEAALEDMGFSEKEILTNGLRVRTTLNKKMQRTAVGSVRRTLPGNWDHDKVETGLVSVQPGTGEVLSFYGGNNYLDDQYDNVFQGKTQPGSSFKPYVLAAGLQEDIGLKSRYNGDSPKDFPGYSKPVRNAKDVDYGMVDLLAATKHSVNTAYVELGFETGLQNVVDVAGDAGLPTKNWQPDPSYFLGTMSVRPVDQAAGMAMFAAGGKYAEPHLVKKVRGPKGKTLHDVEAETYRALPADIAADVAFAMQRVARPGGTGADAALDNRPIAGKTGTSQDNRAAWFVGYTPQVATAVAMFNSDNKKLTGVPVYGTISGPTVPVDIWHAYMSEAMKNLPVREFPEPEWVGETLNSPPPQTVSPTPSETTAIPEPAPTSPNPGPSEGAERPTAEPTGGPYGDPGQPGDDDPGDPGPGDGDDDCGLLGCSDGSGQQSQRGSGSGQEPARRE